jgi:hypothetical protein
MVFDTVVSLFHHPFSLSAALTKGNEMTSDKLRALDETVAVLFREHSPTSVNWYGYHYHDATGKRHCGITTDPQRRQSVLQERWPGGKLYLAIGPVTEAEARAWEALQTETITPQRR